MSLSDEMEKLARLRGGSHKTRSDRVKMVRRFARHLRLHLNIQIRTVGQIKADHIERYLRFRLENGLSKRSMQNELAAIRSVLEAANRMQLLQLSFFTSMDPIRFRHKGATEFSA